MTVTVNHAKTNAISDWTQAQLDEQIALGNFAPGTTLANIVLPSDWNDDHTLTGLGTMAEQDANNVAITGGTATLSSVTTPSVTATTNNLTLSALSTGSVYVNQGTNGATGLVLSNSAFAAASARLFFQNSNGTTSISNINGNTIEFKTNATINSTSGVDQLRVSHTASAVNYVQVTGSATGNATTISAQGSDGSIFMQFNSKGTSGFSFYSGSGTTRQLRIDGTSSGANFLGIAGSATGQAPILSVASQSSDTNVSLAIQPKGTGAIDLAAGSRGVNISNGGTVTAITRTAAGSAYTSKPTLAISAPTTAGGVQATASVNQMQIAGATIASGGTGYTAGDTLTIVGGTPVTTAATLTVSTVSSGVITGVSIAAFNNYTALPTNPVSVTGGTGSGATFNLTFAVINFTITNAGSGYIEQPTITFSGGDGSGAAAYARVGSGTVFRTLGSNVGFYTPGGPAFEVGDLGATTTDYISILGSQSAGYLGLAGSSTNSNLFLSTKGTGGIGFFTNGQGVTRQFSVNHTASAVNYVQVTGAVTTGQPTISAQGSDTNVSLSLASKGTGIINLQQATNLGRSSTNWLQVAGNGAGLAPSITSVGGDTNIDLALTPKGTGNVRYGTHTATADVAISGYIEIKDSGGTIRKLAVIT